ncbi:MAG: hypothetical protein IT204_11275 [Fimbriimonadaceae bacterium]|nr:hypothetical protein [Fimbriimonadaceae bacterium]
MRRQRLELGVLVLLALGAAPAQQLDTLPFYEDQLAGVKLGWHGRSITGKWNFDNIQTAQQGKLRRVYQMPDHIIMRLGTRPPLFTGSGVGRNGQYNFYLGTYGRGNAAGGGGFGGGGGGAAGAPGAPGGSGGGPSGGGGGGGPSASSASAPPSGVARGMAPDQIDDPLAKQRIHEFIAQAQGAAPPPPAPGGPAAPGASGPSAPGGPSGGGGGGGGGGGIDGAVNAAVGSFETAVTSAYMEQLKASEIPPDAAEREFIKLMQRINALETRVFQWEERRRVLQNQGDATLGDQLRLVEEIARMLQEVTTLREQMLEVAAASATLRQRSQAQAFLANFRIYYHVFHVGQPGRDIVFCYKMGIDTWLSVTVNFYTWQVDGITVANSRSTWDGARTSSAPNGQRGIALGDSLERVFDRYGWPDGWESFYGRYLLIHYYDTNNVGFLLDHPRPKVWRVIRMIIEPRPNAQERQLGGVQLGLNAQQLLTIRSPRNGRLVYGEPHAIEQPNHRLSRITAPPDPGDWPPGVPIDATIFGEGTGNLFAAAANQIGGQASEADAIEGASGGGAPNLRPGTGGGYDMPGPVIATPAAGLVAMQPGLPAGRAGLAQAQAPAMPSAAGGPAAAGGPSGPGEAGGAGGTTGGVSLAQPAGDVLCRYPMPFSYGRDTMNLEPLCLESLRAAVSGGGGGAGPAPAGGGPAPAGPSGGGAAPPDAGGAAPGDSGGASGGGGGGGAGSVSRESLAAALNLVYGDLTGQTGYNIAFGARAAPGLCLVTTAVPETQFRWDYTFRNKPKLVGGRLQVGDTKVEFGLDSDGMCTQISVMGSPWEGARTKRGIMIGSSLRDVMLRYGPPLLYDEFINDVAEQQPNLNFISYARDEVGRPVGNLNMVLQDKHVTALQVVRLNYR